MEEWDDKNVRAHINFRVSLEGARLDYLLGSKEELQRLRHDYASLTYETKLLKYVLKHRGIDLEQEVIDRAVPKCMPKMSPKGGEWDEEDDEKYGDCPAAAYYQKNTRPGITKAPIGDDDVVATRKGDVRGGKGEELELQVRASASRRRQDVEKEEGLPGFAFRG